MTYEVIRNCEMWDCPFCDENTVSVIHFPQSVTVKRSKTASLSGSEGFHVNPHTYIVSSGCSKCGETVEEVAKKLNENGTT